MRVVAGFVLIALLLPIRAMAQGSAPFTRSESPVSDAVRNVFTRESKNLIASAELLPADRYGYHPTPAQMTFGQLMVHIVQTNIAICGGIAEVPAPIQPIALSKLSDAGGKDALVPLIRKSFDFCAAALAKVSDAQLADEATSSGRQMGVSRAVALITIATDWADHYSTAATYLRLNDILPPSAPRPAK